MILKFQEFLLLHCGPASNLLHPIDLKIRKQQIQNLLNGDKILPEELTDEAKKHQNKKKKELKLATTYSSPTSYLEKGRNLGKPIGN